MRIIKILGHQGDVPIFEIDNFPKSDKIIDKQCSEKTLAYGEITGHAHFFEDTKNVNMFKVNKEEFNGLCFFEVTKENTLIHGRARNFEGTEPDQLYHDKIKLIPGKKYVSGIFPDTDWITKVIRRVVD